MGMMLPNDLIWIMEKLGFEWPDVDEDELRRAGEIMGRFRDDLELRFQAIDRTVNNDLAPAMRGQAGPAFVSAWNTNRSNNIEKMLDVLTPVPAGLDIAAGVVTALKLKVIAEVTTTALALVPMLTNPLGIAGIAPMLFFKKKLLDAAIDIAVEEALAQVLPMIIEPLTDMMPAVIASILDAPVVEAAVGEPDEFYADLQAMEQAEADLDMHSSDIESLVDNLASELSSLSITGD